MASSWRSDRWLAAPGSARDKIDALLQNQITVTA
jgi:hypothetical protein